MKQKLPRVIPTNSINNFKTNKNRRHKKKYLLDDMKLVTLFFLLFFQMPMEMAEKINEISDPDVFIHDFVENSNSLFSNITTHPANRRSK